jgi:hypothetical protein
VDIRFDSAPLTRFRIAAVIAIAVSLVVPAIGSGFKLDFTLESYYAQMESLEKNLARPFATSREAEEREDRFFYEMARTVDTGTPGLGPLFSQLLSK